MLPRRVAPSGRFELPTRRVEAGRSCPLSYEGFVSGQGAGHDPAASAAQARRSAQPSYTLSIGAHGRTRTPTFQIRNLAHCPVVLRARLEPPATSDPASSELRIRRPSQ